MIYLRRIVGHSMMPALKEGQLCLFMFAKKHKVGDIVLVNHGNKQVVKRVSRVQEQTVDLLGDNTGDSLDLPEIPQTQIVARLVWPQVY